jgi:hypothetical protein
VNPAGQATHFGSGISRPQGAGLDAGFYREVRHRQLFRIHLADRALPWDRRSRCRHERTDPFPVREGDDGSMDFAVEAVTRLLVTRIR